MNAARLAGKVCLVTGGAQGIGRAIVERFVQEGAAAVAFLDTDHERGEASAAELGAEFLRCDITVEPQVEEAIGSLLRRRGEIDVLVNNAGVSTPTSTRRR